MIALAQLTAAASSALAMPEPLMLTPWLIGAVGLVGYAWRRKRTKSTVGHDGPARPKSRKSDMNGTEDVRDEVRDLTWAVLDERAAPTDFQRLEALLLASLEARRIYIMYVQLHVDLCILLGRRRFPLPAAVLQARQRRAPGQPPPSVGFPPGAADSPTLNGHGP
jgi:hypothetical protein